MSSKYQRGKIYKIVSDDLIGVCYIGSTVQSLSNRMAGHRANYKSYLKRNIGYTSSFELLKTGNAIIYLIEDYPCTTKTKLERREGELIRQYRFDPTCEMVCNRVIAGRSGKEYRQDHKVKLNLRSKHHHQDNKVQRCLNAKKYREDNKEKIKEQRSKSIQCPHCSRTVAYSSIARHQRSKVCKSHQ